MSLVSRKSFILIDGMDKCELVFYIEILAITYCFGKFNDVTFSKKHVKNLDTSRFIKMCNFIRGLFSSVNNNILLSKNRLIVFMYVATFTIVLFAVFEIPQIYEVLVYLELQK